MKNATEEVKLPKASKKIKLDKDMARRVSKTELLSYTIKAIIPTGAYANIQPEIIVMADSLEEAEAYVIPHINKLFRDFLNKSERRDEIKVQEPTLVTATGAAYVKDVSGTYPRIPKANFNPETQESHYTADVSPAFIKAEQAINSCLSNEALDVIQKQIEKSVKLSENEKVMLTKLSAIRFGELNIKK